MLSFLHTCLSVSPAFDTSWTLDCQILSETYGQAGDRGAPAFFQVTFLDDIELVGILAGGIDGAPQTYYSPMEGIREDLVNPGETLTIFPGQ